MGNSITKEQCVSIENISEIKSHNSYTVTRTSGAIDEGWTTESIYPKWFSNKACFDSTTKTWRIYMENGKADPNLFVCGWRALDTIYPTAITDVDAWRLRVYDQLTALENQRLAYLKVSHIL
jgi:hypothetical protein